MVEVAEEVKHVRRILPRAIIITWIITSLLYVALLTSVLAAVFFNTPDFWFSLKAWIAPFSPAANDETKTSGDDLAGAAFAVLNDMIPSMSVASRRMDGPNLKA